MKIYPCTFHFQIHPFISTAKLINGICKIPTPISRWWFQSFLTFTPILGEMIQFDEHIFPPTTKWIREKHQFVAKKYLFIPDRWRSRIAFEFGSRFHSPSQEVTLTQNCQVVSLLLFSKNFPTYPWNIPKRSPVPTVYFHEFRLYLDSFGEAWGMLYPGYVGVPLDIHMDS